MQSSINKVFDDLDICDSLLKPNWISRYQGLKHPGNGQKTIS